MKTPDLYSRINTWVTKSGWRLKLYPLFKPKTDPELFNEPLFAATFLAYTRDKKIDNYFSYWNDRLCPTDLTRKLESKHLSSEDMIAMRASYLNSNGLVSVVDKNTGNSSYKQFESILKFEGRAPAAIHIPEPEVWREQYRDTALYIINPYANCIQLNIYQGEHEYLYCQYVFDVDSHRSEFGKVVDVVMDLNNPDFNKNFVDYLYSLKDCEKLISRLLTDSRQSMPLLKSLDFDTQTKLIAAGTGVGLAEAKAFISLFDIDKFVRWNEFANALEDIAYKDQPSIDANDIKTGPNIEF